MNQVGVVAALAVEARTLGRAVRRRDGLSSLPDGALLAVGGMGGVLAASAARRLAEAGAVGLLSFGFAGGLDPELNAGALVCPVEVISGSGARFAASTDWRERLRATTAARQPLVAGALLTRAAPIDSVADKAVAFRETGAVAVDMESLAVAEVAAALGLPQSVLGASRGGNLSMRRLLGGLALAPWECLALIRLAQRYRAATRSLAAVAGAGLPTPQALGTRAA